MIEKRFRYVDATDEVDEHIIDYDTEPHFEYYTLKGATDKLNELVEENQQLKSKGLKVLEFYEDKLKNADRKEFENAKEELWIVKEVLCEMGVIKDE